MLNRSTTTNLLESIHDWIVGLGCSNYIDVVYIDFSKAFDKSVVSLVNYLLGYLVLYMVHHNVLF